MIDAGSSRYDDLLFNRAIGKPDIGTYLFVDYVSP